MLAAHSVIELPPQQTPSSTKDTSLEWKPLGPFPHTIDLFADSSVYILDTPGHLPGHVNLLCRIAPRRWICLCGDAFHDRRLLSGEKEVGTWVDEQGATLCIHLDKGEAERSLARLRALMRAEGGEVELVAAHDEAWLEANRKAVFPGRMS